MDKVIELKNGVAIKEQGNIYEILLTDGSVIKLNEKGRVAFFNEVHKKGIKEEKEKLLATFTKIGEKERRQIEKALEEGFFKDKKVDLEIEEMFGFEAWLKSALTTHYDFWYKVISSFQRAELTEEAKKMFPEYDIGEGKLCTTLNEGILCIAYNMIRNKGETKFEEIQSRLLIIRSAGVY